MYSVEMLKEELKNKVLEDRILFTEAAEVDAKECFSSHFMSDFLAGKGRAVCLKPPFEGCGGLGQTALPGLVGEMSHAEGEGGCCANAPRSPRSPRENLSPAARAVLDAGRELWRYYHAQPGAKANAAYYDIRRHFQGMKKTASGKEQMNATSGDERYNTLLAALRAAMKRLAAQIEPKVYAYGFLKK